jgi:hypothetical protein
LRVNTPYSSNQAIFLKKLSAYLITQFGGLYNIFYKIYLAIR